ncbi:MAG: YggS family pyridoxal phosphate-dependent enzyme [Candidatus Hodarchaeota archaeon]
MMQGESVFQQRIGRAVENYHKILFLLPKYSHNGNVPQLIIVTKSQPVELVSELITRLKKPIFGENRVNEALTKIDICGITEAKWHFIGHLQRNKVKKVLGKFSMIQSLDSLQLVKEIEKRAVKINKSVKCLLQIDICQDGSKFGIPPNIDEVEEFLTELEKFPHIQIKGLMTMAPYVPPEDTRVYFRQMRGLYDILKKEKSLPPNVAIEILSMGMSNDFLVALQEGSTMIRLGTAIFN